MKTSEETRHIIRVPNLPGEDYCCIDYATAKGILNAQSRKEKGTRIRVLSNHARLVETTGGTIEVQRRVRKSSPWKTSECVYCLHPPSSDNAISYVDFSHTAYWHYQPAGWYSRPMFCAGASCHFGQIHFNTTCILTTDPSGRVRKWTDYMVPNPAVLQEENAQELFNAYNSLFFQALDAFLYGKIRLPFDAEIRLHTKYHVLVEAIRAKDQERLWWSTYIPTMDSLLGSAYWKEYYPYTNTKKPSSQKEFVEQTHFKMLHPFVGTRQNRILRIWHHSFEPVYAKGLRILDLK